MQISLKLFLAEIDFASRDVRKGTKHGGPQKKKLRSFLGAITQCYVGVLR